MAAIELASTPLFTDASLLAYYKLESTADSKGSFTLTNVGTTGFSAALFNNGASFNGSSKALHNTSVLASTSYPRSFVGWFNGTSFAADSAVFCCGDDSIHYYILKVRASDSHLVFRSNNNTQAADVDTGIVCSTGNWYNFVVVQNSSTSVTIYVNGSPTNTAAATFVATVSDFWLGYLGRSSVWWFTGLVDDCAIFTRTITATEASNLYNGTWSSAHNLTLLGVGA